MTTSSRSKTASPTACATSCGAIIRRSAPWVEIWPATLSSICGTRCRHRRRRRASLTKQSSASSRATAFAASMPRPCATFLRQKPLPVANGTIAAATAHIRILAARLRLVNTQIKETERRLDELCAAIEAAAETAPGQICEQRDIAILRSYPGLGGINVAALLAEACEPLRRRDYHALRTLSGAAPVTKRSGKSCVVVMRQACHMRLRSAVYHW